MKLNGAVQYAEKQTEIEQFLAHVGWEDASLDPLPGDCSPRQYLRLRKAHTTRLLMIDPPPAGKVKAYCTIAMLLEAKGLRVPHVEAVDYEAGLALIEDFGDQTFTNALQRGMRMEMLYEMAVEVLVHLRQAFADSLPQEITSFSESLYVSELKLFTEWYYPAMMGKPLPAEAEAELGIIFKSLWQDACLTHPETLVLKDFHVDNLMLLSGATAFERCGLLDFQDALQGPAAYDVTSLFQDSRIAMEKPFIESLLTHYLKAFPEQDDVAFMRAYHVVGAQRNIKNFGVFARMFRRSGKTRYLAFIPRLWENVMDNLAHPALDDVQKWLDTHLPATKRGIPA